MAIKRKKNTRKNQQKRQKTTLVDKNIEEEKIEDKFEKKSEDSEKMTDVNQTVEKKKGFFKRFRRSKPRKKIRWLDVIVVFGCILFVGIGVEANILYNKTHYTLEFYQMNSRKLSHSIRIIFLTDIHLREYGPDNQQLVEDVEELEPDIIILGGDLVIDTEPNYDNMVSLGGKLSEIAPTYGVLGNHEDVKIYLQKDKGLVERFQDAGVKILVNGIETLTLYNNVISLAGLDGDPNSFEKYGAKECMERFEETDSDFQICIAHVPTYFPDILSEYHFELGLAGDAHGGLVRLPKLGALYSPDEGFFPEYAGGDYVLSNKANLIVSRGLGDSSKWPRINNVPELSVIDID